MATPTLEERVAALELEVVRIKQMRHDKSSSSLRGWRRIVGVFQDNPDFEEAVRFGREWRAAEPTTESEGMA